MKKSVILLLSVCVCFLNVNAQKKKKGDDHAAAKDTTRAAEPEEFIYNKAISYGDYEEAKSAMYSLMQKHPENHAYLDSLTRLYFALAAYPQCILAGSDYLSKDTGNKTIMEIVAISDASLNRFKESLDMYDKLWKQTGNSYFAYQIALNQYRLKRYGECAQTIDIIIKDPAADKQEVTISLDQTKTQKVAMKAACYNLLGVIQKELSMKDKAKESFEAAIKISPDFELAKSNLEQLDQKEEQKKK